MKKYKALILTLAILSGSTMALSASGEYISDRTAWEITASSSEGGARAIIDGAVNTYWHSIYKSEGSAGSAVVYWREAPPHRITITLPSAEAVAGFSYVPRQDMDLGRATKYTIYVSSGTDTPVKVAEGEFDSLNAERQNVNFDKSYLVKTFVFEINEGVEGFAVIPEIDLIRGSGGVKPEGETMPAMPSKDTGNEVNSLAVLDRTGISGTSNSIHDSNSTIAKTMDGDDNSYWHSKFSGDGSHDMPPFEIIYTMPKPVAISGIIMTPRQDRDLGRPAIYNVYITSEDNEEWELIYEGTGNRSAENMIAQFSCNVITKKLKVEYLETVADYGTLAEINFIAPEDGRETVDAKDYKTYSFYEIENIKVYDNSGKEITKDVTDNSLLTYWRPTKGNEDYAIELEFNSVYDVASIMVHPYRIYNFEGLWNNFDIQVSVDGYEWETVLTGGKLLKFAKNQNIDFNSPVKAKYVRIIVKETEGNYIGMTEIAVYQNRKGYEDYVRANTEKYVLKIGESSFEATRNGETYTVETDASPFIKYDTTYIQLRALLEEMGAEVFWDGMNQAIGIEKDSLDGHISIFMNIMDDRVYVTNDDVTTYDTVRYTLRVPPLLENGRTYIPLRFVSEHLGYQVEWDEKEQKVTVSKTVE